jgi:hypothetical protein
MAEVGKIETVEDFKDSPIRLYQREIEASRKELEKFHSKGRQAYKRYRDDREGSATDANWMNLWWSDTNVLKSAIYARHPKADVSRRHKDPGDDVGRVAGEMLERILNLELDSQTSDIHTALRQAVEDRLVPGLGQVWLRYEPTIMPGENGIEEVVDERVPVDHVDWRDFRWSPARTWQEVRWVARPIYLTRAELEKQFGAIGKLVPLNASSQGLAKEETSLSKNDPWQKACVWEMWKKDTRTVCWFMEGFDKILKEADDPLKLEGFFPCPQPFCANVTTESFVPKSTYTMLFDKYTELDTVNNRITLLEQQIRVVGAYDKTNESLKSMLEGNDNVMIAVDNWAMFAEKGGIKGTVDWFPLEMVVAALDKLQMVKVSIIADLRELAGISDIMRGETKPQETLGAQQMKAQFGSVRLQFVQGDLAAFVQQVLSIKSEIIAAHFQPETIKRMSGILITPDAAMADDAVARLKDKRLAHYSLQVDPDTMAMQDYAQEQESRVACVTALGQFMTAAMPLVQTKPETIPFLLQMLQWVLSSFKAGKQIEGVLDQAVRQITQAGTPQPDPLQEAMKQQQVRKVAAGAQKDETAAVKNIADARAKQAQTVQGGIETIAGVIEGQQSNQAQQGAIQARMQGKPPEGGPPQ